MKTDLEVSKNDVFISVIISSYDPENLPDIEDSIDSILNQSYNNFEIIMISESEIISDVLNEKYDNNKLKISTEDTKGIAEARNKGAKKANGELLVFTDDDIKADEDWLYELVKAFKIKNKYPAFCGNIIPLYEFEDHDFLPEEFYWLIGCTHKGFNLGEDNEVRNGFGPNMAVKKTVFNKINGFNEEVGKKEGSKLQGEEPELGIRIRKKFGKGFYYNSDSIVKHKIKPSQLELTYLISRSFYQGYTKSYIKKLTNSNNAEKNYMFFLLKKSIPNYLLKMIKKPTKTNINKFSLTLLFLAYTGLGFLYYTIIEKFNFDY